MEKVRVVSTCKVLQSISSDSTPTIELTPWDLTFLKFSAIQRGLIFRKPEITDKFHDSEFLITHLKTSLAQALDVFPLLSGRILSTTNDENTSFFIKCNNAGALFTHATINLTIADITVNSSSSFFLVNNNDVSEALLAVQVTEFRDGIFIGCSIPHRVVDGTSFWHFMNSWSEISRGLGYVSISPDFTRRCPHDNHTDCFVRIPIPNEHLIMNPYVERPLQERVFHFSQESIAKLKAKANAEMKTNRISSFQALLAHLWRSVTRCRSVDDGEDITLVVPISARSRLRPPLPEGYFGNTARGKLLIVSRNNLLNNGLGWVAWEINQVVASETNEELLKFYEEGVKCPYIIDLGKSSSITTRLSVTSSPRFNVYGNDFGWGAPIATRSGNPNHYDGKIIVLAGVKEGDVEIEVCLSPEVLIVMELDEEFMDAVATCY